MIPAKEKARELIFKYESLVTTWDCYQDTDISLEDRLPDMKKCALIVVDVILDARPGCPYPQEVGVEVQGIFAIIEYPTVYWNEVRKEIENYEASR